VTERNPAEVSSKKWSDWIASAVPPTNGGFDLMIFRHLEEGP
jgi:hypothetical protein